MACASPERGEGVAGAAAAGAAAAGAAGAFEAVAGATRVTFTRLPRFARLRFFAFALLLALAVTLPPPLVGMVGAEPVTTSIAAAASAKIVSFRM
jgi:hypothetical protein